MRDERRLLGLVIPSFETQEKVKCCLNVGVRYWYVELLFLGLASFAGVSVIEGDCVVQK